MNPGRGDPHCLPLFACGWFTLREAGSPAYNAPEFFAAREEPPMNRRTFLETAAGVTAGTLLANKFSWAAAEHHIEKVGLQLYTVRDLMKADFDSTIARVASIGYK